MFFVHQKVICFHCKYVKICTCMQYSDHCNIRHHLPHLSTAIFVPDYNILLLDVDDVSDSSCLVKLSEE